MTQPNQTLQPTAPGEVAAGKKFVLRRPARWLSLGRQALPHTTDVRTCLNLHRSQ
jgi:hypothetical protein